jgi:hypothetical protein
MNQRVIPSQPEIVVSISEDGEIVLEQRDDFIHVPREKIHLLTVWMRRLAAQLEGLPIPE